ncbi:MAG: hypothetical protein GOP50_00865 [Candidatus Heimdallarchaeota archaeon]|nr:hypothetical protein [Candidatus Heimdallarchaeota archaeon]
MLSLPKFLSKIQVSRPIIYLWRTLRYALPLFAVGIVVGLAPAFSRIVI